MEKPWLHKSAPDGAVELQGKETHTPTPNPDTISNGSH